MTQIDNIAFDCKESVTIDLKSILKDINDNLILNIIETKIELESSVSSPFFIVGKKYNLNLETIACFFSSFLPKTVNQSEILFNIANLNGTISFVSYGGKVFEYEVNQKILTIKSDKDLDFELFFRPKISNATLENIYFDGNGGSKMLFKQETKISF